MLERVLTVVGNCDVASPAGLKGCSRVRRAGSECNAGEHACRNGQSCHGKDRVENVASCVELPCGGEGKEKSVGCRIKRLAHILTAAASSHAQFFDPSASFHSQFFGTLLSSPAPSFHPASSAAARLTMGGSDSTGERRREEALAVWGPCRHAKVDLSRDAAVAGGRASDGEGRGDETGAVRRG